MRIDFEKFLDEATVDEFIQVEDMRTSIAWLKMFWARFLVNGDGERMEREEAERVLGGLTLGQFRVLRREGELRDLAVPPGSETD